MEVYAVDTLSGCEKAVVIDEQATVSAVRQLCGDAFGYGEDVELTVGEQRVTEAGECIASVSGFTAGCHVGVVRGVATYIEQLNSWSCNLDAIPLWARLRKECVLAALSRLLDSRAYAVESRSLPDTLEGRRRSLLYCKAASGWFWPYWVPPSLHADKEVMLRLVQINGTYFFLASAELRRDKDIAIAALKEDPSLVRYMDPSLQEDRDVALFGVPYCKDSAKWLAEKDFVLEAVAWSSLVFEQVSEELRSDKDVAMRAFDSGCDVFAHIGEALRGDKDIAMRALDSEADIFLHTADALRGDKDVVMKALRNGDDVFQHASEALRGDKEVLMAALEERPTRDVYKHASEELREDDEVKRKLGGFTRSRRKPQRPALKAMPVRPAGWQLEGDKSAVLQAVREDYTLYPDASDLFPGDKDIAVATVSATGGASLFPCMPEELRNDLDVALPAIRQDQNNFMYAGQSVQGDKTAVLAGFDGPEVSRWKQGLVLLPFASSELQADREVAVAAVRVNPLNSAYISPSIQEELAPVVEEYTAKSKISA
eukprot:TRINITY_DN585_c1_g1_i1.p1 TRINITY_DN585_c1_g1~~TRINITY_DN585_c1_g1_i1.p1  ORF type:complete len:542 (+),score=186.73 TRINITY_DN585_c1_g1_i1:88-1713(+)